MELEINQKIEYFPLEEINARTGAGNTAVTVAMLMAWLYPASTDGMAVALDNKVITKADWSGTYLKERDKLLILTATQGG